VTPCERAARLAPPRHIAPPRHALSRPTPTVPKARLAALARALARVPAGKKLRLPMADAAAMADALELAYQVRARGEPHTARSAQWHKRAWCSALPRAYRLPASHQLPQVPELCEHLVCSVLQCIAASPET
jgi:hypothetical protein